jgi:hypothetical protein
MFCSMDHRISKHLVKDLKTNAQRTTANIHIDRVNKLVSSGFHLLLSATEKRGRLM